jgi:putative ABC transport system permease protein
VVGVAPPEFRLFDADVFVAGFERALLDSRIARVMGALGRLAPGVSLDQARAELETVGRRLSATYPATNARWTFRAMSLQEAWLGAYRPVSLLMLGAAAMVLLIACANAAGLLLERGLARTREMTVRLALGAARQRIVQQALTESLVLAILGGVAGVLAAWGSLGFVVALMPANTLTHIPGGAGAIRLDVHTLGVALALCVAAAALSGIAPAVRLVRASAHTALRDCARGAAADRTRDTWRRVLVVTQAALSTVLLTGAALMIQSFARLQGVDRGYDPDHALSFELFLPQTQYPQPIQRQTFFSSVIEKLQALPGVMRVGGMTLISSRGRPFSLDGQPTASRDAAPTAVYRVATSDYLAAIGIPLVRGRRFSEADRADAPMRRRSRSSMRRLRARRGRTAIRSAVGSSCSGRRPTSG